MSGKHVNSLISDTVVCYIRQVEDKTNCIKWDGYTFCHVRDKSKITLNPSHILPIWEEYDPVQEEKEKINNVFVKNNVIVTTHNGVYTTRSNVDIVTNVYVFSLCHHKTKKCTGISTTLTGYPKTVHDAERICRMLTKLEEIANPVYSKKM